MAPRNAFELGRVEADRDEVVHGAGVEHDVAAVDVAAHEVRALHCGSRASRWR